MKVIFMGTPDFAVPTLKAIHKANIDIPFVITQPDRQRGRGKKIQYPPVKEAALDLNLKVLQPENIKEKNIFNEIKQAAPDAIVVVAYGKIIPKDILDIPIYGCLNVHASILPKYRGAAPIHWALINGETETGVTIMKMDEGLDTGDILEQAKIDISINDNLGIIHDKLSVLGADLMVDVLRRLPQGIKNTPQNPDHATYAPKIERNLERINWNADASQIHNLIRGLNPWPGAFTALNNKNIKIWDSEVYDSEKLEGQPGNILKVCPKEGIFVQAGKGIIRIKELQLAGRKRLASKEFLKGNPLQKGDSFR